MAAPPNKLLSAQNPRSIVGLWIFAVLWCGISFTVFWTFAIKARGVVGGGIGGLFSLIGLVVLYGAIHATLEYLKYGRVYLVLEGDPPAAGGSFAARLHVPDGTGLAATLQAELACLEMQWTRGAKGRASRSEREIWSARKVVPVRRGTAGGYAALSFDVPADRPASDLPEEASANALFQPARPAGVELDRGYHRWELRVKAAVPGIDLERTFALRVAPGPSAAPAWPGPRPVPAAGAPRALSADIERRIDARRAEERKLAWLVAFLAIAPFIVPFAIAGLAVGLAGCPMSWGLEEPPHCEFAGVNFGVLMAKGFDFMFVAVPAGIAGSAALYFLGRIWLDRRHGTNSLGGPAGLLIGLVATGFVAYHAWQFMRPPRSVARAPAQVQAAPAARPAAGAEASWREDHPSGPRRAPPSSGPGSGSDEPAAARSLYQQSLDHERRKDLAGQERALLGTLAILEQHSVAAVQRALGGGLDKEVVARRLGDFYWDRRRYDRAYAYYDKAYRYAAEVPLSEAERNRRLARNSAGRMAGACTQGDWAVADAAMAELKARIVDVDDATRKQLEYWIRTGEPRLAARRC